VSPETIEPQNLTRSCHEALILAILEGGDRHGYQLALELEEASGGEFRFNHGTLYPILHKLEQDSLISGAWDDDSPRRKRKRYALTARGKAQLKSLRRSWGRFFEAFFQIVGKEGA
jgi:PadR family transcriptional regulator PadR